MIAPSLRVLLGMLLVIGRVDHLVSFTAVSHGELSTIRPSRHHIASKFQPSAFSRIQSATSSLFATSDDKEDRKVDNLSVGEDNFDAQGFVGYLAPYVLALVASTAVTAGFVKFVLSDY